MGSYNKPQIKVILLGKENSGKTCLLHRYIHGCFLQETKLTSSIGGAFVGRTVEVDGSPLVLGIWDTAGAEKFDSMTRVYYRGAGAAIVCYDLSDKSTFQKASFWIEEIQRHEDDCKIYICGTKLDLIVDSQEDIEDINQINKYAKGLKARVYQTSSVSGYNVNELFTAVARDYLEDPAHREIDSAVIVPGQTTNKEKSKSSCCSRLK